MRPCTDDGAFDLAQLRQRTQWAYVDENGSFVTIVIYYL